MTAFTDPLQFLRDTGLHDAEILSLEWQMSEHRISISLDNLYANVRGLPEDPGRTPGRLVFERVTEFSTSISPVNYSRHIYDIETEQQPDRLRFKILCSPGGILDIACGAFAIEMHAR